MSKVDRFWSHEAQNIRCVRESDYDKLGVELVYLKSVEKERNNLRAELAAIKAGQGEAVAYAYEYGKDNGDGSFSVTITRGQIPSYLTPVKDWAIKPLYTAPPASADAVSVPRELLERLIKYYEDGMSIYGECEELRALLARSESKEVKP